MSLYARYQATQPTYTDGQIDSVQMDKRGNLRVSAANGGDPAATWTVVHQPAAATQATASKAAGGAGVSHVCTAICATFVVGTTAAGAASQVVVNLRDGATGAGTVLWSGVMALPTAVGSACPPIVLSGLNIKGTANTAMTLEFGAAGSTNTFEAVSISGYDIS